jgi:Tol biopolymer transport system component
MRRAAILAGVAAIASGCGSSLEPGLGHNSQLFVVDSASGERRRLTQDGSSYWSPSWSPDSERLAVVRSAGDTGALEAIDLDDGSSTSVVPHPGVSTVEWSPRGSTLAYMLYREPTTHIVGTVESDGSEYRQLSKHRSSRVPSGPSWAPDGAGIAYAPGGGTFVVSPGGGRARLLVDDAWEPRWSPDGRSVLALRKDTLVAAPVDGAAPVTVASGLIAAHACWSPASDQVAFAGVTWDGDRRYHLYLATPGSGEPPREIHDQAATVAPAWSPDGRRIAFAGFDGAIRIIELADGETTTLTRVDEAEIFGLTWSPDGSSLAFVANRRHEGD